METNKSTLDVAVALQPIMGYLYKHGIIGVYGEHISGHIQLTENKFREIWPDVEPDSGGHYYAEYSGFTFTACHPREVCADG